MSYSFITYFYTRKKLTLYTLRSFPLTETNVIVIWHNWSTNGERCIFIGTLSAEGLTSEWTIFIQGVSQHVIHAWEMDKWQKNNEKCSYEHVFCLLPCFKVIVTFEFQWTAFRPKHAKIRVTSSSEKLVARS